MTIGLYTTTSDRRRVRKSLTSVLDYINAHLKEDTSIIDPVFRVHAESISGVRLDEFNYLYCSETGRYYFVNDVKLCKGGILEIYCHVDVLYTYRNYILNHNAYVDRSEVEFYKKNQNSNGIFFDNEYPIRTDSYLWTEDKLEFGSVANSKSYYLTVNGGVMQ